MFAMAGCNSVLKSAEQNPLTDFHGAMLLDEVGIWLVIHNIINDDENSF
jgi:hypothetical protein